MKIISIGKFLITEKQITVEVTEHYARGLKEIEHFSHLRIICLDNLNQLTLLTAELISRNRNRLLISTDVPVTAEYTLLDIKPYMPMEDRVQESNEPENQGPDPEISSNIINTENSLESIGHFRNRGGSSLIELKQEYAGLTGSLKDFSHLQILWSFHRMDSDIFRKMLVCKPPYEAPRTGVFASRAPVRPNPIGLTVCRVNVLSENTIQVESIDCFEGTPVLMILPYRAGRDRIDTIRQPLWLKHWPDYIAEKGENTETGDLKEADITLLDQMCNYSEPEKNDRVLSEKTAEKGPEDCINIYGARQNNLKNIDVSIPLNKLTVITGLSGSGKTSLAFDTLYAEGQRRFMQNLSASARRSAGSMEKPDFDRMENLRPALAIEQKNLTSSPRSTVGSLSETSACLRLLYARLGKRYCSRCGTGLSPVSAEQVTKKIIKLPENTQMKVFSGRNDKKLPVSDIVLPEKDLRTVEFRNFVFETVSRAYAEGKGFITLNTGNGTDLCLTETAACTGCDAVYFKPGPSLFSYNSPAGMCPVCKGMGKQMKVDPSRIIAHPEKSLLDEASPWYGNLRKHRKKPNANWFRGEVLALAEKHKIDLELPWNKLPEDFRKKALFGAGETEYSFSYSSGKTGRTGTITRPVGGAVNHLQRLFETSRASDSHEVYKQYLRENLCPDCKGERLAHQGRFVKLAGVRFPEVESMTLGDLDIWLDSLESGLTENRSIQNLLAELRSHIKSLLQLGLHYLTLSRSAATLSGGELQRIKLSGQLGSDLTGLLYVLDEPSIGLHKRDHKQIIQTMWNLRDAGNTVVVVEHDRDTMLAADHIIDMGPGAGSLGGRVTASGSPEKIMEPPDSLTGKYLSKKRAASKKPAKITGPFLTLEGAVINNLKNISVRFPLGKISVVTGVSGSGKSSLIRQTLVPALIQKKRGADLDCGPYSSLKGWEDLSRIVHIDQKPIGRSPRSVPATYIGFLDDVRNLFAATETARQKKFKHSRFSFNDKQGRCPACEGLGKIKMELSFLPDAWITCPDCNGKRFNTETLDITWKGKTIHDVLQMDVDEAVLFFTGESGIVKSLTMMQYVGLGYLKLGQNSATLSGGEAQRIKLTKELITEERGRNLYILDEPTTGLHFADIEKLIKILQTLSEKGNTIIIIEHDMDMIRCADWLVDLGPEGGNGGGYLTGQGTPEELSRSENSVTGHCLKER